MLQPLLPLLLVKSRELGRKRLLSRVHSFLSKLLMWRICLDGRKPSSMRLWRELLVVLVLAVRQPLF